MCPLSLPGCSRVRVSHLPLISSSVVLHRANPPPGPVGMGFQEVAYSLGSWGGFERVDCLECCECTPQTLNQCLLGPFQDFQLGPALRTNVGISGLRQDTRKLSSSRRHHDTTFINVQPTATVVIGEILKYVYQRFSRRRGPALINQGRTSPVTRHHHKTSSSFTPKIPVGRRTTSTLRSGDCLLPEPTTCDTALVVSTFLKYFAVLMLPSIVKPRLFAAPRIVSVLQVS